MLFQHWRLFKKMMEFYQNKGIDMLKLGCTLLNLANICLHKSTNQKFFPFVEADKDLHDKIREDMTGGLSILFTRKAVVDQTFIRNYEHLCKSIVCTDASPFNCIKKCSLDFTLDGNLIQILKNSGLEQIYLEHLRPWLCHIFNHSVPNVKLRAPTQLEIRRLIVLA